MKITKAIAQESFNYSCIWYAKIMAIIAAYIYFVRSQKCAADDFACKIADVQALEGGISFFESYKEADPLIGVEYETISPFIPAQDVWGQKIQDYIAAYDEQNLQDMQEIQQDLDARLIFDVICSTTHPGSSSRIQKIQAEIDRRIAEIE